MSFVNSGRGGLLALHETPRSATLPSQRSSEFAESPVAQQTVSAHPDALASARAQVAAVRDDPAARLALMARVVPRLQPLFEWSAGALAEPRLLGLVRDGNPIYVWPYEQRHVWRSSHMPLTARILERATRARAPARPRPGR